MCPFCLSTVGLVVVSAISSGGLTALAAQLPHKKSKVEEVTPSANGRNSQVQKADWSETISV